MNTFPKFTTIADGCFSYKKLEKEGRLGPITCFIDETQVDCETWGGEDPIVYDDYTDPYGGH